MTKPLFGNNRPAQVVLLFTNFFLIIAAYYHLKPASRSIFISVLSADQLPYVWIATAVSLGLVISAYHRIVARHTRIHVVLGTCASIITLLLVFYPGMREPGHATAFSFYVFVDMLSVILVEQFWSLTNTVHNSEQGKRWYGLIAAGGLFGGVAGGALSWLWIKHTGLETVDLLLVAAGILSLLMLLTLYMGRLGLYSEHSGVNDKRPARDDGWRAIMRHRYLFLIALLLLLAQMVEPLVEYQFMKVVESNILEREARTAYLGGFFSVLSAVAIGINLLITPLLHHFFGAIGGLLAQPSAVLLGSLYYMSNATLSAGAFLKIADRGLSYSINRASKELLYVPIEPLLIYRAKAWIDMFGYRLFKVLGSVLILLLTQWLPWSVNSVQLSWLVLGVCGVWFLTLLALKDEYIRVRSINGKH